MQNAELKKASDLNLFFSFIILHSAFCINGDRYGKDDSGGGR
jgi:hypothetical protein